MHRRLEGIEGLSQTLDDFAAAGAGVVAVNGGDGTVPLMPNRPMPEMTAKKSSMGCTRAPARRRR